MTIKENDEATLRLLVATVLALFLLGVSGMFSGCYTSRVRSETPAGTRIEQVTTAPFYGRRDVVVDSRGDYERCLETRSRQGQWLWSDDQATCYRQTTSGGDTPVPAGYGYGGYGAAEHVYGPGYYRYLTAGGVQ
jgi:hypothetical protein